MPRLRATFIAVFSALNGAFAFSCLANTLRYEPHLPRGSIAIHEPAFSVIDLLSPFTCGAPQDLEGLAAPTAITSATMQIEGLADRSEIVRLKGVATCNFDALQVSMPLPDPNLFPDFSLFDWLDPSILGATLIVAAMPYLILHLRIRRTIAANPPNWRLLMWH